MKVLKARMTLSSCSSLCRLAYSGLFRIMSSICFFILISVDYLERFCGFGNKRINKYLDFVNKSLRYVEEDPDYFKALAAELKKEIGIDFIELWKEQADER